MNEGDRVVGEQHIVMPPWPLAGVGKTRASYCRYRVTAAIAEDDNPGPSPEIAPGRPRSPRWTVSVGTTAATPRSSEAIHVPTPEGSSRRSVVPCRYWGPLALVDLRRSHCHCNRRAEHVTLPVITV